MALIYHAIGIEDDGYLDEKGQQAWRRAGESWKQYGDRAIRTADGQHEIRLNDLVRHQSDRAAEAARLDKLAPAVRQQLIQQRRELLLPAEREALDMPLAERTMELQQLADIATSKIAVQPAEIAQRARRRTARRPCAWPAKWSCWTP